MSEKKDEKVLENLKNIFELICERLLKILM